MLRHLRNVARAHPKATALFLLLVLVAPTGSFGGWYAFALHQWHAAQEALQEDRLPEARSRLEYCLTVWPSSVPVHLLTARAARLSGDFKVAESHLNRCKE